MKILLLTPRIPYPLRDGGAIAMNQTIEGLIEAGCEVHLLAMNTARHWVDPQSLPPVYEQLKGLETVFVNNSINPLSAFLNLFTDKSYNISRFEQKEFTQHLKALLQKYVFDVVFFESIYTSPYLKIVKEFGAVQCVCRVHNIEHQIWQHLADNEKSFLKKKYLHLLTSRLKQYELDILQRFDALLPISMKEFVFLEQLNPGKCLYLPFGVEEFKLLPEVRCEKKSCYHIGSMDWAPNVEGVEWFLQEVWQPIKQTLPEITFYVAGKNMPANLMSKRDAQIEVVGEVEDFVNFSLSKNILIVPLRSGAGVRIKILEAMAMGKTIISTSMALEGIEAIHEKHVMIADTPEDFQACIHRCFQDEEFAIRLGENAKEFVLLNFNRQRIYHHLLQQLKKLLRI